MKVVLDTSTLVSAIGWEGPSAQVLDALIDGRHTVVTSAVLLAELNRVLTYPRLRRAARSPRLPYVLAWLYRPAHIIVPRERLTVIQEDPADDRVLEAAAAGKADVIVSGDRHLLALTSFRSIPVLSARQFVERYL